MCGLNLSSAFLFAFLFCIALQVNAQNLVPDSGFEIVHRLPVRKENSLTCTKNWMSPTQGASDYYHKNGGLHAGVPSNVFGVQKPHSGKAYAGICVRTNFIEYVQTRLTDKLVKGSDYLVECYISRAELSIGSVKEFGVLFIPKMTFGLGNKGIRTKPNIIFDKPVGYKSKSKWTKFSAVYRAQGNEGAFILGYFNHDPAKRYVGFAHYYIDDVSITLIPKATDTVKIEQAQAPVMETFSARPGETVILQNIFFASNRSELLPESFSELDKLTQWLTDEPGTAIKISGHTDQTGDETHNLALSEARARSVADYLVLKGIDLGRISYSGFGSAKPIATNATDEGKQQNRRVEFTVSEN